MTIVLAWLWLFLEVRSTQKPRSYFTHWWHVVNWKKVQSSRTSQVGRGRKTSDDHQCFLGERIIDVKTSRSDNRINTPLGELIAIVSEFAFDYSADSSEAYDLARLVLVELLKGASPGSETLDRHFPETMLLH